MGFLPPVGEDVINRGAEIGQTLFAGFALAVGFGKLGADSGKTGFAVDGTVVKLDGQVHKWYFESFHREGKGPALLVNVNGGGGRFEVKGGIPPPAFHLRPTILALRWDSQRTRRNALIYIC